MDQTTGQLCNLCLTHTWESNPLRTIPTCKHTLCEGCLNEIIGKSGAVPIRLTCPFDGLESTFYSRDFSNPAYLQSVSKTPGVRNNLISVIDSATSQDDDSQFRVTVCEKHRQPTALWCHQDRRLVCPKCALFSHAEHKVEPLEQDAYEQYQCSKELLSLLQNKQSLTVQLNSDSFKREARKEFQAKRKATVRDIKKWFVDLFERLADAEKTCLDRVDRCFRRMEQKHSEKLALSATLAKESETWEAHTMKQLKRYEESSQASQLSSKLSLLTRHLSLVSVGQDIVEKLKDHLEEIKGGFDGIKQCVVTNFEDKISKALKQLPLNLFKENLTPCVDTIKEVYERARKLSRNTGSILAEPTNDELLLEDTGPALEVTAPIVDHSPALDDTLNLNQSFRNVMRSSSVSSFHGDRKTLSTSLNLLGLEQYRSTASLRNSSVSANTKRSTIQTNRQSRNSLLEKPTGNPLRKLAQCTLPDKYKRFAEDLSQNRLSVLDLSYCELDLHGLNYMLELAQNCSKLRTIKLIKCRLTDANMEQLWSLVRNATTLNLSQNHLTDKSLESLAVLKQQPISLRSVVLSQNCIKERAVRARLEELGRLGLSVTL